MVHLIRTTLLLVAIFLVGCTYLPAKVPSIADERRLRAQSQSKIQEFRENWKMQAEVAGLAYPILTANSDLCGEDVIDDIGIEWVVFNDFPAPDPRLEQSTLAREIRANRAKADQPPEDEKGLVERIAARTLGIRHTPYLMVVVPGSPADIAGMLQGDILESFNGKPIRRDRGLHFDYGFDPYRGTRPYRWHFHRTMKNAMRDGSSIAIHYLRGGELLQTEIQPSNRCNFDVMALDFAEVAATSEEGIILVSSGLYEFAQSDLELQVFVAYQLAHELAGHRSETLPGWSGYPWLQQVYLGLDASRDRSIGLGGVLFSESGAPYSHIQLINADYMAMYMLAQAGIDVSQYASVWTSLPIKSPMAKIHPVSQIRVERMSDTLREITEKLNAGLPLNPVSN